MTKKIEFFTEIQWDAESQEYIVTVEAEHHDRDKVILHTQRFSRYEDDRDALEGYAAMTFLRKLEKALAIVTSAY